MTISLIAAVSENGIIGGNNQLVWNLPVDTRFFMKTTEGHCILTGRRNYESIPEKFRPLKNRTNIVVTTQQNYLKDAPGLKVVNNIQDGIEFARSLSERELFIIGGGEIYTQTIQQADRLYLTEIKAQFKGDTYFPSFNRDLFEETSRIICRPDAENAHEMHFVTLERK
ncbi:MAG: dihydrofolate reductase [Cyclobacteriaceae bacterium]|nr:MAG: dihydrofolate reductase [Cyclobacteriaceae bacterium]